MNYSPKHDTDRNLLKDTNTTGSPDLVHTLFLNQVRRNPQRIALRFRDQCLTYEEVERRSGRVAQNLIQQGVGPGDLVTLCLPRSELLVIAALGILRAGAAYVPLDPTYPEERQRYIVEDSGARFALMAERTEILEKCSEALLLDELTAAPRIPYSEAGRGSSSGDTAYVIYTSGSTGNPKGVKVEHASVVNFIEAMCVEPGLRSQDIVLAITTICFDIAVLELFAPLAAGATVVIAEAGASFHAKRTMELLESSRATVLQATPTTWELLLAAGWKGHRGLKALCGGEALPIPLARELLSKAGEVYNLYGPTETTVWSAVGRVTAAELRTQSGLRCVPIGQCIRNTGFHIVDPEGREVREGEAGELIITGSGLAQGYHRKPGLTAERFVPGIWDDRPQRGYRTGDRVRRLDDQTLEFLGRLDNQIKLGGHRIELGEVEAVLRKHPAVAQAAVVLDRSGPAQGTLVAYWTPAPQPESLEADKERVEHWRQIWEAANRQASVDEPVEVAGYHSSYSGAPIPAAEIDEWLEHTCERVRALQPERVLEIGCGAGALIPRLAAGCRSYLATDISEAALEQARKRLEPAQEFGHVRLMHRAAHESRDLEPEGFDTIVLNSVIQYFPSSHYLEEVLRQAWHLLAPGGCLFIGDVRNLHLLDAFHASVAMHQAPESNSLDLLRSRFERRLREEQELVLAPSFFSKFAESLDQDTQVDIQVKRGRHHNELVRFRYDVTLHKLESEETTETPSTPRIPVLTWGKEITGLNQLAEQLRSSESLQVTQIPNAQVWQAVQFATRLRDPDASLADLPGQDLRPEDSCFPEDLWALAAEHHLPVTVRWSGCGPEYLEAFFGDEVPSLTLGGDVLDMLTNHPEEVHQWKQFQAEVRDFVGGQLPRYMVPTQWVILPHLPMLPNGKLDRRALPSPMRHRTVESAFVPPLGEIEEAIAQIWQEVLEVESVGAEDNFFDLGGSSLLLHSVLSGMERRLGIELSILDLFQAPSIRRSAVLVRQRSKDVEADSSESPPAPFRGAVSTPRDGAGTSTREIAIVGMACRFPGAADLNTFWQNLKDGKESLVQFSEEELRAAGVPASVSEGEDYVAVGGVLPDIDRFDAEFFGYSPSEAELLDPQQRIFLELAWHALEDAGCDPGPFPGRIGLYAGAGLNTYLAHDLGLDPAGYLDSVRDFRAMLGNDKDYIATRTSYKLDLRGPSLSVQTACSTSLVAVHLAIQGLRAGDCDLAMAGAASVQTPQHAGYTHLDDMILSPDGQCRPFDARAQGTIFTNGAGAVVLKRLSDAERDGDRIYAVIGGSAINNDGSKKPGFSAPSINAQAEVIGAALRSAGVHPQQIGYVETHGTATPLGDLVELTALRQALRPEGGTPCFLGAVKSNIGHTLHAAGMAGLIKTALCLHHGMLVPSLHFEVPNPELDWDEETFRVHKGICEWPDAEPRMAGVSSFGIGGTNAHIVLGQAPQPSRSKDSAKARPFELLRVCAKTPDALQRLLPAYAETLREGDSSLVDLCYSANVGRADFGPYRTAFVASDREDLARQLTLAATDQALSDPVKSSGSSQGVVFLYTGQGAQYPAMGAELHATSPVFREAFDSCAEVFHTVTGESLTDPWHSQDLHQTQYAQPLLFALQHGLTELWKSWGIVPAAVLGHSAGEFAAAAAAGIYRAEEAMQLITERALLMQSTSTEGRMLGVRCQHARLAAQLANYPDLSLAALNTEDTFTVSGPAESMGSLEQDLQREKIPFRPMVTSHAFHSCTMDPIRPSMEQVAARFTARPAQIQFVLGASGRPTDPQGTITPAYWGRQLREPVEFHKGLGWLAEQGYRIFVELGPAPVLTQFGRRTFRKGEFLCTGSMEKDRSSWQTLLGTVAELYTQGTSIRWSELYADRPCSRVDLPRYPFAGERHWPGERPLSKADAKDSVPSEHHAGTEERSEAEQPTDRLSLVCQLVARVLGTSPDRVDATKTFVGMSMDSLAMIEFLRAVRERFAVRLSIRDLLELTPTPSTLAEGLPEAMAPPLAPPVEVEQPSPAQASIQESVEAPDRDSVPLWAKTPFSFWSPDSEPTRLTPEQREHLDDFVTQYAKRTQQSKQAAQDYRAALADRRSLSGFRAETKEIFYPIVGQRSEGARLWDVDGNEYIDITMGFGVHLLGHRPESIQRAVEQALAQGFQVGPQSESAGEVAEMICELTGKDRVSFCNSGTEAVMTALRIARAATGRRKIVMFKGAYHGHSDTTLALPSPRNLGPGALPLCPGVSHSMVADTIVLDYGEDHSLEWIEEHGETVAALLVEPVQSRRLSLQPGDFLKKLQGISQQIGSVLLFDEIITGFRVHPRGAQGHFGVEADLCTYGKVVGGGLPIGVVAGRADLMARVDGGPWAYGDDSAPQVEPTYYAGTFCKHPLAMASTRAMLTEFRQRGAEIIQSLNQRTEQMAERLNGWFKRHAFPLQVEYFGSVFRFTPTGPMGEIFAPLEFDLFFLHLVHRGIYVWEGRVCFLSAAHTSGDVDRTVDAVQESLQELRAAGFWRDPEPLGVRETAVPEIRIPLGTESSRLLALCEKSSGWSVAYNEAIAFDLRGQLDVPALAKAFAEVVDRHEALRFRISAQGDSFVASEEVPTLQTVNLGEEQINPRQALERWLETESMHSFDLRRGPLVRATLLRQESNHHTFSLIVHHLISDGVSLDVILRELADRYNALFSGRHFETGPPHQYSDYLNWWRQEECRAEAVEKREFWARYLESEGSLSNPVDGIQQQPALEGRRITRRLEPEVVEGLRSTAAQEQATPFMLLLAAFTRSLHVLKPEPRLRVDISSAGRDFEGGDSLVGCCRHVLPLLSKCSADTPWDRHFSRTRRELLRIYPQQDCSLGELLESRLPNALLASFNLDQIQLPGFSGLAKATWRIRPIRYTRYPLALNILQSDMDWWLDFDYGTAHLSTKEANQLLDDYLTLLRELARPLTPLQVDARADHDRFLQSPQPPQR